MNKETISNNQGIFVMSMFIIGSTIVLGTSSEVKQDVWIAILMALLMSIPMLFVYSKLLTIYPGKDLYEILKEIFGNIVGKIISLLFIWYSFHLGALVLKDFSEFIKIISFSDTPQSIIIIFMGVLCIWIVKAGIEVLGRWAAFAFPIIISIIIITNTLAMTKADFINLKPILYDGIKPVLSGSFSIFAFPFAETVIFTMVFNTLKNNKKTFEVFFISTLIGCSIILLVSVRNILVLGPSLAADYYFPSYISVRAINIANFLQRFEVIVGIVFVLGGFVKISVCLLAATKGVAKILNIENYRHIVTPISFAMMALACIVYENTMEMFDWATKIYQYYAIPFQIIFPIITLIVAKIEIMVKSKKQKVVPVNNE